MATPLQELSKEQRERLKAHLIAVKYGARAESDLIDLALSALQPASLSGSKAEGMEAALFRIRFRCASVLMTASRDTGDWVDGVTEILRIAEAATPDPASLSDSPAQQQGDAHLSGALSEQRTGTTSGERNHRRGLVGVAEFLVSEMEGDNGCTFVVTEDQARRLNEFAYDERMQSITVAELDTLASGEHGGQLDVIAKDPDFLTPLSDLLNDIFENPEIPARWDALPPASSPNGPDADAVRDAVLEEAAKVCD